VELDSRDRASLDAFAEELRRLHGPGLVAALLTGEAASAAYVPGRTPLSTVVVLQQVTPEALRRTRPRLRGWGRRRIPAPLFLDPLYIESALDVFPLEFLELMDHHRLLSGERDPLSGLAIERDKMRIEVEEQLRGKLLHLWEVYLEAGGSRQRLRRLLLETPPGFSMILRGLLYLETQDVAARPDAPAEILRAVEERFSVELPVLRRLEALHRGEGLLARGELDEVFEGYLDEVRRLVRITDGR
jgi:hypothetical protein